MRPERLELSRPLGHYLLKVARLPDSVKAAFYRDGRDRTYDLSHPMRVRYLAALRPGQSETRDLNPQVIPASEAGGVPDRPDSV